MSLSDIESRQKPSQLLACDRQSFVCGPRPPEPVHLEFFVPQTIAGFIPVEDLQRVPMSSAEYEILPAHRIELEFVRD